MIPHYHDEMERIHALEWDKQQRELEIYARDLYAALTHRDQEIERLRRRLHPRKEM